MSEVLCIDFGTSSIRAVRRFFNGNLKILDIGRVTKSRLDDASIRSDIYIDKQLHYVHFGESAILARAQSSSFALYESSPKLWLKDPNKLKENAATGLFVNQEQLLSGLIAYAIRAAADAENINESTLENINIIISHPVWPEDVKDAVNAALSRICAQAKIMAFQQKWDKVEVTSLVGDDQPKIINRADQIDVVEPVAAATDLLPSEKNVVRLCTVVDVGAGTTDIGLFRSVIPDPDSQVHSKLYLMGKSVSLFKAGDFIDEILLRILKNRAKQPNAGALADVRARIRGIKETLFRDKFVQELGCNINLKDLESHPDLRAMASEIRTEILSLIEKNATNVKDMLNRSFYPIMHLDLIMAGGGGNIEFLKKAIMQPIPISSKELHVIEAYPEPRLGINMYGASRGRLAVALGGASEEYETVIHEEPKLTMIRRGSL